MKNFIESIVLNVKIIVAIIMDSLGLEIKTYAGGITTTELVNRIYNFCEVYSGRVMYPYQGQFSKRIIRSVLENDGAELTALFSRQSGKTETVAITVGGLMIILPQLANMPMFLNDRRLMMFKDGLWVGIFAPSQRQAQTTYGRMKSRMQCKEAQAVLNDPDFRLVFTTSNGQTVALSNGSFCTAISASDGSNIEGESFKFIILEECFVRGTPVLTDKGYKPIESVKVGDRVFSFNHNTKKVELKTVQRSFGQPIHNRKLVVIKTETGKKIVCTDNHKIFVPKVGYVRADSLQVNDLVLLYSHTTQGNGEYYNEPNDFRNNVGGWEYYISRQKILKKSKAYHKSFFKTGGLCLEEVRTGVSPMLTRTQSSSEFRKRKLYVSIHHKMSSRDKNVSRNVLQRWKEDYNKKSFGFNDRGSFSLLVSRRRKYEWYDEYSYTRLFHGRELFIGKLVNREVQYNTIHKCGQKSEQAFFGFQGEREKQVSEVGSSLYCGFNDVQDSFNRFGDSLQCLWKKDNSLQAEKNSFLFKGMSEDSQQDLYERILQEEKIVSIEYEDVGDIEVFDLTVKDNHNFFANGVLVHNCQDISNYKIRKSVHPMGAAYNATICKIGTATTFKGDFYEAIQRNKQFIKDNPTLVRNHFEYDCDVVARFNPSMQNTWREKKEVWVKVQTNTECPIS